MSQPRRSAGLLLDQYLSTGSSIEAPRPISPLSRFRQQVTRQQKCLPPRSRTRANSPRKDFPLSRIWDAKHAFQLQTLCASAPKDAISSVLTQQQPEDVEPPRPHAKPIKPAIPTACASPAFIIPALLDATQSAKRIQRRWHLFGSRRSDNNPRKITCTASFMVVLDETARPLAVPKRMQRPMIHPPPLTAFVDTEAERMEQQETADHGLSSITELVTPPGVPFWVDDEWSELEEGRYVGKLSAPDQEIDPEELVGKSTVQLLQMTRRHEQKPLLSSFMDCGLDAVGPTQETDPIPEPEPSYSTSSQHRIVPSFSHRIALKGFRRRKMKTNALQRRGAHLCRKQTFQRPLSAAIESIDQSPELNTQASTVSTELVSTGSDPLENNGTHHTYVVFSTPSVEGDQSILRRNDLISIEDTTSALTSSHVSQGLHASIRQSISLSSSPESFLETDLLSCETSQVPTGLMGANQQLLDETERAQDQAQPLAVPHGQPFASQIHSAPSLQWLVGGDEPGLDDDDEEEEELLALGHDVIQTKQHEFLQVLQDFKQSFQRAQLLEESPRSSTHALGFSQSQYLWAASTREDDESDLELQAMMREIRQLSMGMGMFPPANPIGLGNHAD